MFMNRQFSDTGARTIRTAQTRKWWGTAAAKLEKRDAPSQYSAY